MSVENLKQMFARYCGRNELLRPNLGELELQLSRVPDDQRVAILKTRYGFVGTPINVAVANNDAEIMVLLLHSLPQHMRLEVLLVGDFTPVHQAARFGRREMIRALFDSLDDKQLHKVFNLKDHFGRTPAERAEMTGYYKTLLDLREYQLSRLLRKMSDSSNPNTKELTQLLSVIKRGHLKHILTKCFPPFYYPPLAHALEYTKYAVKHLPSGQRLYIRPSPRRRAMKKAILQCLSIQQILKLPILPNASDVETWLCRFN